MRPIYYSLIALFVVGFSACEKSTEANCPSECANNNIQHVNRVLVLGIDGCRSDALQQANTPNLDQLIANGRYSWFVDRGNHYTWSGAGWSSLLTGVWPDKHGVTDNLYGGKNYGQYPHFMCRLKKNSDCFKLASIVHYAALNDEIASPCNVDVLLDYSEDELVTQAAVNHINDCEFDVVFVNFDDVDHAGHTRGFHPSIPQYMAAIEGVDAYVGRIMEVIYNRESSSNENWLVVVGTDHGGKQNGTHGFHDNDTDVTRVFSIYRKRTVQNQGLMNYDPAIVDIVPTIFDHLSIPIDANWELDGTKVDL